MRLKKTLSEVRVEESFLISYTYQDSQISWSQIDGVVTGIYA